MRTLGDLQRWITQKKDNDEQMYTLPYSEKDASVAFEKGTAAKEKQQLFTTGQQQPQILWENSTPCDVCTSSVGLRSNHVDLLVAKKIAAQQHTKIHENKGWFQEMYHAEENK